MISSEYIIGKDLITCFLISGLGISQAQFKEGQMNKIVLCALLMSLSQTTFAMNRKCLQKMDDMNSKMDSMQIKMDLLLANTCPPAPTPTPTPNRPVYSSQNMQVGEPDRMFITNKLPLYIGVTNILSVSFPEIAKRNLTANVNYIVNSGSILNSSAKDIKLFVTNKDVQIGADLKVNNLGSIEEYTTNVVQLVAVKPPRPTVALFVNGAEATGLTPVNRRSQFTIKVRPDSDFARLFPNESSYFINTVQVLVQRSLGAPTLVKTITVNQTNAAQGVNLNTINELDSDVPGTKVFFKIDSINRLNSKGELIEEQFSESDLLTDFTIR